MIELEKTVRQSVPYVATIERIKNLFDDGDYLKSRVKANRYVAAVNDNLVHVYINGNRVTVKPVISKVSQIAETISNRIPYGKGIGYYTTIDEFLNTITILIFKQL